MRVPKEPILVPTCEISLPYIVVKFARVDKLFSQKSTKKTTNCGMNNILP